MDAALERLRRDPGRTGIFTDFDGTLAPIVDRPQDAAAAPGAEEALAALAGRYGVVAVVSGRSLEDLRARVNPAGVILAGSYGRERSDRPGRRPAEGWEPVAAAASALIAGLDGVVLERKGAGVALHYRAAPMLADEVQRRAGELATEFGLEVLLGKLVAELVRPGPGKGDAVAAIAEQAGLGALLFAGDDVADLEAFAWARRSGLESVLVAVASEEAPAGLVEEADVVLDGPAEVVELLERLV